jgi:hypothetical protein
VKESSVTHPNSATGSDHDGVNLRLVWPQWQGAGTSSVRELASEFPFDAARRGYAVGSAVLEAVLPQHDGPSATVPVPPEPGGLTSGEVRRIITDIDGTADNVAFTIAEFIPRQVMHLQQLLSGFPLISGTRAD